MRKLTLAFLAAILLAGCASQPKFSGRPPSYRGEAAESVWRERLATSPLPNETKATIRAARAAKITPNDYVERAAKTGSMLAAPSMVRTENNGQLDLFLGDNGPTVRVTEKSVVNILRLNYDRPALDPSGPKIVETMIEVLDGRILGNVKPMEAGSIYMIRTAAGVIRIRGTQFEVAASGETHIIEGEAEVFASGKRFTIKSGQSYFPNSGLTVGDAT